MPLANKIAVLVLCLPLYPNLDLREVTRITDIIYNMLDSSISTN